MCGYCVKLPVVRFIPYPYLALLCTTRNYISQASFPSGFWVGVANGRTDKRLECGRKAESRAFLQLSASYSIFCCSCICSQTRAPPSGILVPATHPWVILCSSPPLWALTPPLPIVPPSLGA